MAELYRQAILELESVAAQIDDHAVDRACEMIADARRIGVYGCGREGLQLRGFAMRLFHLGRDVSVVGDMTMPPLGAGDLFIVSAGPGYLSTAMALATVARDAGAKVLLLTAQPAGRIAALADHVLVIPAQTMADDRGPARRSLLPMGSVFEGALFVLFEVMVLKLQKRLHITLDAMRANHTNME
ncbi:MAG: SIS domain-containing protein [Rhizobiaceae bacterium]